MATPLPRLVPTALLSLALAAGTLVFAPTVAHAVSIASVSASDQLKTAKKTTLEALPTSSSTNLAALKKGRKVIATGAVSGSWIEVSSSSGGSTTTGWVRASRLTDIWDSTSISVAGTAKVGETLTARTSWEGAASYSYQWLRSGKAISGARSATYQVATGDIGKKLAVKVTGKASGLKTLTKTSASTQTVPGQQSGTPLRAGSFNILVANVSQKMSGSRHWSARKPKVVAQIRREQLDVVGLQEASAGSVPGGSIAQFQDLANALGEPYALTNTIRYCDKSNGTTTDDQGNVFTDGECINGAGQSDRIIYNTERLELERQGAISLDGRSQRDGSARHMTWAVFHDLRTDRRFFFASAHLEPGAEKVSLHARQAGLILAEIEARNPDGLPVVLVGDFSSTKFSVNGNTAHDAFIDAGYADPLGNGRKQKTTAGAFAQSLVNAKYYSKNDFKSAPTVRSGAAIGDYLDYILLSTRAITALEWETVVDLDSAGKFAGVIPSDHNLIKLTFDLP